MELILDINNVTYKIGKRYLLKNINLKIYRGEHLVIFGLNGSGKTTLLSILAGFLTPSTGEIFLGDTKYSNETIIGLRKRIGFVSNSFFDKQYFSISLILKGIVISFIPQL